MATITQEQVKKILSGRPKGVSEEEVLKKLTERGHEIEGLVLPSKQVETTTPSQPIPGTLDFSNTAQDIRETGEALRETVEKGKAEFGRDGRIAQRVAAGEETAGMGRFQRAGGAIGTAFQLGFEALKGAGKIALPERGEQKVAGAVSSTAQKMQEHAQRHMLKLRTSQDPRDQEIAAKIDESIKLFQTDESFRDTVIGAGGFAEAIGISKLISPVVRGLTKGAELTEETFQRSLRPVETPSQKVTPATISAVIDEAPIEVRQQAVSDLASVYRSSLLGTAAAKKQLEKNARKRGMSVDEVLEEFVDMRGIPSRVDDEGRVSFDSSIRDFETRQNDLGSAIGQFLATKVENTRLSDLKATAQQQLRQGGKATELDKSLRELDRLFASLETAYGKDITPSELNDLRIEVNKKFKEADFEVDANEAIGNVARDRIDEIVGDPSVRRANAEWGRLQEQIEVARILDQKRVDVGILGNTFGSYIAATALGSAGLASGSGSLVIAGLVSTFGGKTFANWLRRRKINDPETQKVIEAVRQDEELVQKLLNEVDEATKAEIGRYLLPAAGQTTAPILLPDPKRGAGTPIEKQSFKSGETPEQLGRQDLPEDNRPALGLSTQDRGAFGKGADEVFNNFPDLTAKHLKALEGKGTVNKQFILDTANQPNLKQPERDLIREVLNDFEGQVNVQEYADKIKARLLPLKKSEPHTPQHENTTLKAGRGNVANYNEHIYESPIETSASDIHFEGEIPNYFAHTRIEDMADGKTRRVIEAQSDLFQKGRLEQESLGYKSVAEYNKDFPDPNFGKADRAQIEGVQQLKPYRNTWWERIVREEVRSASKDGKTKLQFPTGETAMKIEGLGDNNQWFTGSVNETPMIDPMEVAELKVGRVVNDRNGDWIITEVLDDGKFKAMWKTRFDELKGRGQSVEEINANAGTEQFDISGKVDTSNPIYRFYEKDVQKYLTKNYGAKVVTDEQGVKWVEFSVPGDAKKLPVEAFGIIGAVGAGAALQNE